jgi:hypothetical protein
MPFKLVAKGKPPKSFGPSNLNPRLCGNCFLFAMSASSNGRALWTAAPNEHKLTKWDENGRALVEIEIVGSPWFRSWDASQRRPQGLWVTRVVHLSEDNTGILWIQGVIPTGSTQRRPGGPVRPSAREELDSSMVVIVDAYDTVKKQIVASIRFPHRFVRLVRGDLIAVRRDDRDGHVYWDVFRMEVGEGLRVYSPG